MSALIKRDRDGTAMNLPAAPSQPSAAALPVKAVAPRVKAAKSGGVRLFIGLLIALAADALDVAVPGVTLPLDIITAILMVLLYGLRWEILLVMFPEMFPGTAFFPTWVILVFYLAGVTPKKP